MSVKVNLLPDNLSVKKGTASLAKVLRSVSIVSLVLTITLGIGLLSFFLISSFELRSVEASVEGLKSQIKAQETTEQRMVLLKDRLSKIKSVKAVSSVSKSLVDINPILSSLPPEASLGELSIDTAKIDAAFIFRDSILLSNFLSTLNASEAFPLITLTSFGFNPSTGYLVGVRFSKQN